MMTERDPRYDMLDTVADGTVDVPACCEVCGQEDIFPNAIAFDLTGETVCDDCAEEIIEDNGQFGMGA